MYTDSILFELNVEKLVKFVHTSIKRTHSLCYRSREYKKRKAFPFFKPPNQAKYAPFFIRITFIRVVRLGVTVI